MDLVMATLVAPAFALPGDDDQDAPRPVPGPADDAGRALRSRRVLVVEDDLLIALGMQTMLDEVGHEVVGVAATGAEAIRLATTADPEVVLMDVRLQGPMDGVEAARRIHEVRPIPIIFVTAYSNPDIIARLRSVAPAEILIKPVLAHQLRRTIDGVFARGDPTH